MNPIQKQLLVLGVAVMVVMGVYPPWVRIRQNVTRMPYATAAQAETQEPAGYAFIYEPPQANPSQYGQFYEGVRIDFGRLLIQWTSVILVLGAGLMYFKDSDKKSLKDWAKSL